MKNQESCYTNAMFKRLMTTPQIRYILLLPVIFSIMWYEKGFDIAVTCIWIATYMIAGLYVSMKAVGGTWIKNPLVAPWQYLGLTYCFLYAIYWSVVIGLDRKMVLLLSPFIFACVIVFIVKFFVRLEQN
ncbi:hypothetical protein [Moritella sp. F3]|uniref:hypothetical protein n=1 Tax=Moritella sp. F3 TaxID=2718882 RepID=UPI0018E0D4F3|nr:hypothetical protein [Moritella sp. F3]